MLTCNLFRGTTIPSRQNSTVCICIGVVAAPRLAVEALTVHLLLKRLRLVKFMSTVDGVFVVALRPSTFNMISGLMPIVLLYLSSPYNLFSRTLRLSPSRHGGVPGGLYGSSLCLCHFETHGSGVFLMRYPALRAARLCPHGHRSGPGSPL